jgi:lipopolysaccharide/colanic/teichoic acid biosynthesis glycosyltransferase
MLKRTFDVLLSLIGVILLAPVLAPTAICIKKEDNGPIFYRGIRIGKHGKPFRIFKFRTMLVDAEKVGGSSTGDDDTRITKVGKHLRKYKLDELPQLINVLRGEMSFVGPRPQVQWAVSLYSEEEKGILSVRPGITDYASVKFSNEGEILRGTKDADKVYMEKIHPEKIRLGLEYVNQRSFLTDMKVILKTIKTVLETWKSKSDDTTGKKDL